MEGLIILVAELLLLPFIAGITALCELVLSLVSLLLQLVFGVSRKRREESIDKKIIFPPALIKWIQRIAVGSATLFATTLLLINFVFLEETVRFAADQVEEKTGFEIQYDAVKGNIFTGAFAFAEARAQANSSRQTQTFRKSPKPISQPIRLENP